MWSTGIIPLERILLVKAARISSDSGANPHPLGLRENIWNTSHPTAFARSTARSRDPAIDMWTPTFTIEEILSPLSSTDQHSCAGDIRRFVFRHGTTGETEI
jgi:hypothetical protein